MKTETFAMWGSVRVKVRYVAVATAFYVPDTGGNYVLTTRAEGNRNPRAIRVETVTTKASNPTTCGKAYRIDQTATARDRETLTTFREQQEHANTSEVWSVSKPAMYTVNYV